MNDEQTALITGYDFGKRESAVSPVSDEELQWLEQTVGWSTEDAAILRSHADLFLKHAESMVQAWRAVIGAQPHLSRWFVGPDGSADEHYKARVGARFAQWVVDVATRPHDRDWLNYQQEIGLRHTPAKKNLTDHARTAPLVPLRYVLGFIPVVLAIAQFFEGEVRDAHELAALQAAWTKAVILHLTLWTRPYCVEGLW